MEIVFATGNTHKITEVSELMPKDIILKGLADIGCSLDLPETSDTIPGNAIQKARYVYEHFGVNCFAEDTGLEVYALNGEPGVYSARYAGEDKDPAANTRKLLEKLSAHSDRSARFRTVIALILDGKEYLFEGIAEGQIAEIPVGAGGFGYDPVFVPQGETRSFAQMSNQEKGSISHRGRAVAQLLSFLNNTVLLFAFCISIAALAPSSLNAQLILPDASPAATIYQRIGLTDVSIQYARPGVHQRKIFGELIPYGEVWRLGANSATLISFSQSVRMDAHEIPAGTYALFAVPGEKEWTWVLNQDTSLWGTKGYDARRDILRTESPTEFIAERVETMELRWQNIRPQSAELVFEWEHTRVRLTVEFATDQQVQANISRHFNKKATGDDYYRAARYYFDNRLDIKQSRRWMENKLQMDGEQFGILRYKALIEYADGDQEEAIQTMKRSLQLAREAGNLHYIRMNELTLSDWSHRPTDVTAEAILSRSIAYHDPSGAWASGRFEFHLYETRPGGTDRNTRLTMDNGHGIFEMRRIDGPDSTFRRSGPNGCEVYINGQEKPFVEAMDINVLRCRDNQRYQNYYTYLYGLPMKLMDEGTIITPQARLRHFFGEEYYEIKVTYAAGVGSDTWYFYFNKASFALSGYRFYHNETENDGEYILLEGEVEAGPLRIPKKRHWYTHKDRLYLGTDEMLGY